MSVRKSLLTRLDDLARLTGIPQLVEPAPRRRSLRWSSLLLLVLGTTAFVYVFVFMNPSSINYAFAGPLGSFGIICATMMQLNGPLRPGQGLDEYEVNLSRDSYLFAFWIIGAIQTMSISFFLALAILNDWSRGVILVRLGMAFVYLLFLFFLLPTLYASWAMPKPQRDEDNTEDEHD